MHDADGRGMERNCDEFVKELSSVFTFDVGLKAVCVALKFKLFLIKQRIRILHSKISMKKLSLHFSRMFRELKSHFIPFT